MTSDAQIPPSGPPPRGAYEHDSSWELPELAPVLIIISVGLLVVLIVEIGLERWW